MIDAFLYKQKMLHKINLAELKHADVLVKQKARLWVAVKNPTIEDVDLLREKFSLHPTTTEDILTPSTRIKYEEFENNTFVVIKGIQRVKDEGVIQQTLFIIDGDRYMITVYYDDNKTVEGLLGNHKKIETLLSQGEDYVVHYIIDKEVDKYNDLRSHLSEGLKNMSELITDSPSKDLLKRLFLKESVIMDIKQHADSLTEVCARLTKPSPNFIQKDLAPYFRDVYDHAFRVSMALKTYLDRISSIRNSYLSLTSNRMNEIMRVLTILMALMMPMNIITGFYGMNVALPLQNYAYVYIILGILMLAIIIIMLYAFKRMKWTGFA